MQMQMQMRMSTQMQICMQMHACATCFGARRCRYADATCAATQALGQLCSQAPARDAIRFVIRAVEAQPCTAHPRNGNSALVNCHAPPPGPRCVNGALGHLGHNACHATTAPAAETASCDEISSASMLSE